MKVIKTYPSTPLANAKVWDIATYGDNWAFFASQDGLMQYDGSTVMLFSLRNNYSLRSVNLDAEKERLFVGGINEFGYFTPSHTSSLEYVCLSDSVGDDRHIGNIWGIYPYNNFVYAQGDTNIIIYDREKNTHTRVDTNCKLDCSRMIDGVLWLGTDKGLKFLMGKDVIDAPGADLLKGKRIRAILPLEGAILVVTSASGVYRYNRQGIMLLESVSKAAISMGDVFSADVKDNLLALGSIDNGVGVIDLSSGEMLRYDEGTGLPNNTILSVKFNSKGDLWTALDPGVAKIQLTLPVETFSNKSLPIGTGYALAVDNGKMYLGTNRGLFYVDYFPGNNLSGSSFRKVEGISGQVWGLSKIDNDLFCCHDRGLFLLKNGQAIKIDNISGVWNVQQVPGNPDKAYAGTYFGLFILKKTPQGWQVTQQVDGYDGSCYNFVQESPSYIWSNDGEEGIYRLKIDTVTGKITERHNYKKTSDGFPLTGNISLSRIDNDIYFSTPFGLYRYDSKQEGIVLDERLSLLIGSPKQVRRIKKTNGWLYAHTGKEIIQADPAGILGMKRIPISFAESRPPHDGDVLFEVAPNYIAYPTPGGYLFYDFADSKSLDTKPADENDSIAGKPLSRINRVSVTNVSDSTVYQGNFLAKKGDIVLKYGENSIKLEFGSLDQSLLGTRYSCRLNNGKWSVPGSAIIKEYTDLEEGSYHFEVKAIGVDGAESIDSIDFKVLPPWWRTIWAMIGYVLIAAIAVYGGLLFEKRRVRQKQILIAKEKDEEMARQQMNFEWESKLKDHKIVELEKEKLDKELKHKAQEMAGVMMNLSHKNETLQTVKKELQNILSLLPRTSSDARKAIQELQGKVNIDLRSDDVIKRVEEEFDLAHNDFIKKLRKRFPDLTNNEVLMCAYIKLNLSTKEIAPLLNISVRGVETMRYRIRKKFNLEREESLTEFLTRDKIDE
ncbi:MAG: hypothetical protein HDR88_01955 [Bacteroides sp.]|nr:hypothetical protein [Bacteroides sp.]